jgi:hypothetical protein
MTDVINSGNKERHATLASELAGRGRELRITTVLFNVGGDTVKSKQTADRLGAAFVDITEKLWRRKADHYLATYPSTTDLHRQFLQAQQHQDVTEDISALPVSRHSSSSPTSLASSSSPTIPSIRRSIGALDIDESASPAATPVRTVVAV